MGENGNYFSDLLRKLGEINFNWRISVHQYRSNPQPHRPYVCSVDSLATMRADFSPGVSMLSSQCSRPVLGRAASVFLAYWQQLIFILID